MEKTKAPKQQIGTKLIHKNNKQIYTVIDVIKDKNNKVISTILKSDVDGTEKPLKQKNNRLQIFFL